MINVLIVEKNLKFCKNLINSILLENDNIKICGIITSIDEMKLIISKKHIDIILMSTNLFKLSKIKKNLNKQIFKNSIILILTPDEITKNSQLHNSYIYDYVIKEDNINNISKAITSLLKLKQINQLSNKVKKKRSKKLIQDKIINELNYLGYNFHHLGTKYILETIYILYNLSDYYNDNLQRDIYPIVAKKFGKSVNNIRCNIRNATDIMYYENHEEKIREYLRQELNYKPGSKQIISEILSRI